MTLIRASEVLGSDPLLSLPRGHQNRFEVKLIDFKGAIFDLDGTLLDTLADIANATNSMLVATGLPPHPVEAYRNFVGEGMRVLLTRVLPPSHRDPSTLESCLRLLGTEYERHLNRTAHPFPGIPELLAGLRERGLRLAVLSNKPHKFTARCVTEIFGAGLFDPILGLRDGRPRKPDPAGAVEIAATWQVPPSQILYIGDSGTDMETATKAGMAAVGVDWGYRSRVELLGAGARRILKVPGDLLNW